MWFPWGDAYSFPVQKLQKPTKKHSPQQKQIGYLKADLLIKRFGIRARNNPKSDSVYFKFPC